MRRSIWRGNTIALSLPSRSPPKGPYLWDGDGWMQTRMLRALPGLYVLDTGRLLEFRQGVPSPFQGVIPVSIQVGTSRSGAARQWSEPCRGHYLAILAPQLDVLQRGSVSTYESKRVCTGNVLQNISSKGLNRCAVGGGAAVASA